MRSVNRTISMQHLLLPHGTFFTMSNNVVIIVKIVYGILSYLSSKIWYNISLLLHHTKYYNTTYTIFSIYYTISTIIIYYTITNHYTTSIIISLLLLISYNTILYYTILLYYILYNNTIYTAIVTPKLEGSCPSLCVMTI